jgi:hypothetical protein
MKALSSPLRFARMFLSISKGGQRCDVPDRGHEGLPRRLSVSDPDRARQPRVASDEQPRRSPRAGSSWRQGTMSTDARLREHPIGKTKLPRSRRTPELPQLSISHAPTRSRRPHGAFTITAGQPSHSVSRRLLEREALQPKHVVHMQARTPTEPVAGPYRGRRGSVRLFNVFRGLYSWFMMQSQPI